MHGDDAVAALHCLENMLIITFFLTIMLLPPNWATRHNAFFAITRRDDVQLVGNDAVAVGDCGLQGIINDGILIIWHAMPNKAPTLRPFAAVNEGIVAQNKVEIIPSVAIIGTYSRHKHRIDGTFGIGIVGLHFPNV